MSQWASATEHHRYMQPAETRRLCWCGCKQQATHSGAANGIALTAPLCELAVRRWVKTGEVRPAALSDSLSEEEKSHEPSRSNDRR